MTNRVLLCGIGEDTERLIKWFHFSCLQITLTNLPKIAKTATREEVQENQRRELIVIHLKNLSPYAKISAMYNNYDKYNIVNSYTSASQVYSTLQLTLSVTCKHIKNRKS